MEDMTSVIEAILFASGEPVAGEKLKTVLGITEDELMLQMRNLSDKLDYERRGVMLIRLETSFQLCTRPQYADAIRHALETRRQPSLSQAALEVLAVVAYQQPVTKAYIEQVRGVDSSNTVNTLVEKGLIEECGRLDVPGRPMLFQTTADFLRTFSIASLAELPDLPEFADNADGQLTLSMIEPAETSQKLQQNTVMGE